MQILVKRNFHKDKQLLENQKNGHLRWSICSIKQTIWSEYQFSVRSGFSFINFFVDVPPSPTSKCIAVSWCMPSAWKVFQSQFYQACENISQTMTPILKFEKGLEIIPQGGREGEVLLQRVRSKILGFWQTNNHGEKGESRDCYVGVCKPGTAYGHVLFGLNSFVFVKYEPSFKTRIFHRKAGFPTPLNTIKRSGNRGLRWSCDNSQLAVKGGGPLRWCESPQVCLIPAPPWSLLAPAQPWWPSEFYH